ncbi:MAG: DNA-processing protein DprA [Peptoniphilaceae bacterium]|nr:DNA-processing protein DprA [Peptoniphilaceae bacterium]MDY6019494.1 DNA-processing protein DprA [Anaerococcus sp.]
MNKKELLTYLNFAHVTNRVVLQIIDQIDYENLFARKDEFRKILDKSTYNKIFSKKNLEDFKYYKDDLYKSGAKIVTIFDKAYPYNLRNIDDRPAILYYKGSLSDNDKYSIAFVGARKCTAYGKWACQKLVEDVASQGITTVSGLAYGIDSICHTSTLKKDQRTIGIIGCGIDQIYPKSNRRLYQEIEEKGLILSEFPLGTLPRAWNFPQRNRIISGISLATVVIEAKEKSGTMITSACAINQGRDVFCVPGNINSIYSKGTNRLIQDGAKLIIDANDIIDELSQLSFFDKKDEEKDFSDLDENELKIITYIEENPNANADLIALDLNLSIDDVNYLLTSLELKDYIENIGGNEFTIKS